MSSEEKGIITSLGLLALSLLTQFRFCCSPFAARCTAGPCSPFCPPRYTDLLPQLCSPDVCLPLLGPSDCASTGAACLIVVPGNRDRKGGVVRGQHQQMDKCPLTNAVCPCPWTHLHTRPSPADTLMLAKRRHTFPPVNPVVNLAEGHADSAV